MIYLPIIITKDSDNEEKLINIQNTYFT